jgi:hypothetical protein
VRDVRVPEDLKLTREAALKLFLELSDEERAELLAFAAKENHGRYMAKFRNKVVSKKDDENKEEKKQDAAAASAAASMEEEKANKDAEALCADSDEEDPAGSHSPLASGSDSDGSGSGSGSGSKGKRKRPSSSSSPAPTRSAKRSKKDVTIVGALLSEADFRVILGPSGAEKQAFAAAQRVPEGFFLRSVSLCFWCVATWLLVLCACVRSLHTHIGAVQADSQRHRRTHRSRAPARAADVGRGPAFGSADFGGGSGSGCWRWQGQGRTQGAAARACTRAGACGDGGGG